MISRLEPLAPGNAVRITLAPPAGAAVWQVLRRPDDQFAGFNDPQAIMVGPQTDQPVVTDISGLANGSTYFYRDYAYVDGAWVDGGTVGMSVVPAPAYVGDTCDPQSIVQQRLLLGLAVEVAAGRLTPASGSIEVHTAPYSMVENVTFPTVSVHLDSEGASERFVGEDPWDSTYDPISGTTAYTEGWLNRVQLNVVGVSLNSDERIALQRAIRRVIQANLSVFDALGLLQIDFSQSHSEEFGDKNATLFMTLGSFSCLAPSYVVAPQPALFIGTITANQDC